MYDQIHIEYQYSATKIYFVENLSLEAFFDKNSTIIITDDNVYALYSQVVAGYRCIIVENAEACKTTQTVEHIVHKLLELKADRNTILIGLGGGAICDIVGYVASVFMRGVEHSFVPTTLLAMIDASIGGKTAVNMGNVKNVIGTFKHPSLVLIYTGFLATLSKEDYYSGLAELIKIALVADISLLRDIQHIDLHRVENVSSEILSKAILRKARITLKDERDSGIRHILNYGHTFGHLIELTSKMPHGLAVMKGMKIALDISLYYNILSESDYKEIATLLGSYDISKVPVNYASLFKKIFTDKKRIQNRINLILLNKIGSATLHNIEVENLNSVFRSFLANKICVSISNNYNIEDIVNKINSNYLVEYRIDKDFNLNDLHKLVDKFRCIISYKLEKSSDIVDIYRKIISSKPSYVDINYEVGEANILEIIEIANANNVKSILSYHNYELTPEKEELAELLRKMKEFNPDIIKIVAKYNTTADEERILDLYAMAKPSRLLAFCIGENARRSRLNALLAGSPFMYVYDPNFSKTAAGQLSVQEAFELVEITI